MKRSFAFGTPVSIWIALLAAIVLITGPALASEEPRITEFMARNAHVLDDEDGDEEDWIEIENPGPDAASLNGWFLTDDADDLKKWRIPDVSIPSGGYLVVFASNKDRTDPASNLHTNFVLSDKGEFVALVRPDGTIASSYDPPPQFRNLSYGVGSVSAPIVSNPIKKDTIVKYHVPTEEPTEDWRKPEFDDASWTSAGLALGFDTAGPYLDLLGEGGDIGEATKTVNASVYVRTIVDLPDPSAVLRMTLALRWEDGVVGWINGEQILAEQAPDPLEWDSAATKSHSDSEAIVPTIYELEFAGKLVKGKNVLAFQAMNTSAGGSDLLIFPELTMESKDPNAGEAEGFFESPSPGTPNGQGKLAPAYVTMDVPTKAFAEGKVDVTITADNPAATIRYTTDTTEPDENSSIYNEPLSFDENTQLRARAYLPGALPGPVQTHAYFKLEEDAAAFTSNLPIVLMDSFGKGAPYSAGDNKRRPVIIAFFEPKKVEGQEQLRSSMLNPPDLVTRAGARKRGSSSGGWAKYQMSFESWTENDWEERTIEPLGFAAEDDWIFGTFFQFDYALIRNPYIYEISRQIGRYAARTKHIELWNNTRKDDVGGMTGSRADYFGVYTLKERLDRSNDRIDVARLDENDVAEPDITGGYIFKKDRGGPSFSGGGAGSFVYIYPNGAHNRERPDEFRGYVINSEQKKWISDRIKALDRAVGRADGAIEIVEGVEEHFTDYLDIDSFIDHIILNAFAMNVDWGRLSGWMHMDRGGKLQGGPIWDFDRNMGSKDGRDDNPRQWDGTGDSSKTWFDGRYSLYGEAMGFKSSTSAGPPRRMSTRPDIMQRWIDRWFELRAGPLSTENILAVVDQLADPIREAQERNFKRWTQHRPGRNPGAFDEGVQGWEGEIVHMKGWLRTRAEWMDDQFPPEPRFSRAGGGVPKGTPVGMSALSGKLYYTTDGTDPRLPGGEVSPTAIEFEGTVNTAVLKEDAVAKYFVPTDDTLGTNWHASDFDDAAWKEGKQGLGFETSGGVSGEIETDIETDMKGKNASVFVRMPFDLASVDTVNGLILHVKSDDGFIAYLNGTEVGQLNAPNPIEWDSKATSSNRDSDAVAGLDLDISDHKGLLKAGTNVLAIHALNQSKTSSDFLIRAILSINEAKDPLILNESQTITARVLDDEWWGAPVKQSFAVGTQPGGTDNLVVSEIMYHPSAPTADEIAAGYDDQDLFEFFEILNVSAAPVDLTGVKFGAGATFQFEGGTVLDPGARLVVVSDRAAFLLRYGADKEPFIAGVFAGGTNLSNSGERILLVGVDESTIREFTYNDRDPWPEAADGDGFSLVLASPESKPDHNVAANWTVGVVDGTPGAGETTQVFEGDPNADDDGDGVTAFMEYALGTLDSAGASGPGAFDAMVDGGGDLRLIFPKNTAAGDATFTVEASLDLKTWTTEGVELLSQSPLPDGRTEVIYQSTLPEIPEDGLYMRLRVTQKQ